MNSFTVLLFLFGTMVIQVVRPISIEDISTISQDYRTEIDRLEYQLTQDTGRSMAISGIEGIFRRWPHNR